MPKKLKNFEGNFKAEGGPVSSEASHTHAVSRGTLMGSDKTWINKSTDNLPVAQIEILAQEFFRLLIPHQSETRLLHDSSTGTYHILSEEVPGYRKLPLNQAVKFKNGTYSGLGQVVVGAMYAQEIDLKNGNVGLDDQNRVAKIDGDWCFAEGRYGSGAYRITPQTIASLPYPRGFYVYNWLDVTNQGVAVANSDIIDPDLTDSPQFRAEVNQAMLRICVLPDSFIEPFVTAFMTDGDAKPFINKMEQRRNELQASALQNPSFQAYLKTEQAKTDVIEFTQQMERFVVNGDEQVVAVDSSRVVDAVRKRFETIMHAEPKGTKPPLVSELNNLLDNIDSCRVNDQDSLLINYVSSMRVKLNNMSDDKEQQGFKLELDSMLLSVGSEQIKASKEVVKSLRENNYWWSRGKESKAERIENALLMTPLEQRRFVITNKGPANKVQEALASHRWSLLSGGKVYKNKNNEIEITKAASPFQKLKKQFGSLKEKTSEGPTHGRKI